MCKKIIIYDFDGTLTPYSLPKFEILEKSGLKDGAFNPLFLQWAHEKSESRNIDLYDAIYEVYFEVIRRAGLQLTDDNFCLGFDKVDYNIGVFDFLENLFNNKVKNYLLSSGVKIFLQKTKIASFFTDIYATTFRYDKTGEAIGTKYLMSDRNKVEAIKEIIKENGFESDDCSNIIYIGDGFTDLYAMDYVKSNGGTTIFVYLNKDSEDVTAFKEKNVVSFYTLADFSYSSELSNYIRKLCGLSN